MEDRAPRPNSSQSPLQATPCLREAVGMTTRLTHLAINADDLDASRRFYAGVLGLEFAEYLGPEFLRTELDGLLVVLQRRRRIGDIEANGPECTFAVDDARKVAERAEALGGRVLMSPTPVLEAGELTFVADPAGNAIGAMQYR
jgi:predicted enzyme related to lactoylglutathione lyase